MPPIFDTILKKIDGAGIFLADVTFVGTRLDGSPTPNPNVLIEYASRILRLAPLSPNLYDAIIAGDHSPLVTLAGVTKGLPLDWERQRLSA
jgi:hypothetical protein